jgi:RNA-binding protein 26
LVKDVPGSDKAELRSHFEKFGEIEGVQFNEDTSSAVVQFKTRREAEQAMIQGSKSFKDMSLQLSWFTDSTVSLPLIEAAAKSETSDASSSSPNTAVGAGYLEEEDEEDDGEERFFKR